jgi:hypothetical protein
MGSSQIVNVQHMVKWIQEKPEALAYIRSQHTVDALPNWEGKLEGNADYAEILRGAGVSVPVGDTMGESVDDSVADDCC